MENFYTSIPAHAAGPVARTRAARASRAQQEVYIPMQGPSEMGASGKLEHWDRSADLGRITVPTLVIGAALRHHGPEVHGMDGGRVPSWPLPVLPGWQPPGDVRRPEGLHEGLLAFLRDVDAGRL
jgi:proline iminopeptidase